MRGTRYTEEQIVGILKEHEAGVGTEQLAGATASASRRFTAGRRSTAAWTQTMLIA